jgi:GR25 family glycosyltransferase involved in LPS biosynthesis
MYTLIIVLVIISIFFLFYTRTKKDGFKAKNKNKKDYLDGIDAIYWINLDRSPDRRQRMEKMFEDPVFKGKKIVRVSAVDGKASDIDQILNASFEGMNPDKFTKGEYACLLSHINIIKQFSESSDETALIMEDDTTLEYKPYWKRSIQQIIDAAPNDWEIIQLCINTQNPLKKLYTRNNGLMQIFGTGAYVINKKCAKNFNKYNYKQLQFSEHTADKYLYNQTVTYAYKYPMFTYNFNESSTIHQDHINDHNRSKKIIDGFIQSSHSR